MRIFLKEAFSYAVLLVILFAIAALAVRHTILLLSDYISGDEYTIIAALICTITLGFMLISGAFGLWAMQFSAKREGRRRVGRFVDAMDYMTDGLLAIDGKARITGSNPAARSLLGSSLEKLLPLGDAFSCLSPDDVSFLSDSKEPDEIERKMTIDGSTRTLRFRCQPSEELTLIMISDVTAADAQRGHNREVARLQLIGQLSRGVAHDFNNLLCAISGHVSLLSRIPREDPTWSKSYTAITRCVEKGSAMAGHLLELAQSTTGLSRHFSNMTPAHVAAAVDRLRNSLPEGWKMKTDLQKMPPVPLTRVQAEQLIVNLGLLVADMTEAPGTLRIISGTPDNASPIRNVGSKFAGLILIGTEEFDPKTAEGKGPVRSTRETGVIASVLESMIEGAGGKLDFLAAPDGSPIYRIALPRGITRTPEEQGEEFPANLEPYVATWSVLLASPPSITCKPTLSRLESLGAKVKHLDTIVASLAEIEESEDLDAIIVDEQLLAPQSGALLKAIVRLCPAAGTVVLCEDRHVEPTKLATDVVFIRSTSTANNVILAMIEAKSLAVARSTSKA